MSRVTTNIMYLLMMILTVSLFSKNADFFKNLNTRKINFKSIENSNPTKKNGSENKKDNLGREISYTFPIPLTLELKYTGEKEFEGEICYILNTESSKRNPNFGKHPTQPKNMEEYSEIYISKKGVIKYIKKISKAGGNTNTNEEWNLSQFSTVDYFYGKWMLDLKKGYHIKKESGNNYLEIEVKDIKKKNGKKYFIVHYFSKMGEKVIEDRIYHIDFETRITLYAENNNYKFNLIN